MLRLDIPKRAGQMIAIFLALLLNAATAAQGSNGPQEGDRVREPIADTTTCSANCDQRRTEESADLLDSTDASRVEIYCEFRCPFCAKLFARLATLKETSAGELTVSFHHYYFHEGAEEIARYFEAASFLHPNERSRLLHNLFRFRNQSEPKHLSEFLRALSVVQGFDHSAILKEMRSRPVAILVTDSKRRAIALGVHATPTVYVDGKELAPMEPEEIAASLAKQAGAR